MAVVQPYFDPTTLLQGGSIFSAYLQGFVKERSAMNRQMMELALAQADPKELYDQLESINKQIEALREFKYEVSTGRSSGQQLASQTIGIYRDAQKAKLERETAIAVERAKQGGAAKAVYEETQARVIGATVGLQGSDAEKAAQIINKGLKTQDGDLGRQAFFNVVNKAETNQISNGVKTEILKQLSASEEEKATSALDKQAFLKNYRYEAGGPDPITEAMDLYAQLEDIGLTSPPGSGRPTGISSKDKEAIDKEIQSLEEERKQLKQQLEAARSGNVDIFQSFSGNYSLDNPFINVKTAYVDQPGVFAIASAVQDSKQAGRMVDRGMAQGERQDARQEARNDAQFDRIQKLVEKGYDRGKREIAQDKRQDARQEARERRGEPVEYQDVAFFAPFLPSRKQTYSSQPKESVAPQQETSVRLPPAQVFTQSILNDFKNIELTEAARNVIDTSFDQAEKQLRLEGNTNPTVEQLLPIVHLHVQNILGNDEYPELDEKSLTQLEQIFVGEDENPLNLREIAKRRKTAKENQ